MKTNEQYQNSIKKKIQTPRGTHRTKTPFTASGNLSFHQIQSGKSITLSRYDTIELWVQEVHLDKGARIDSFLTLGGYDEITGEPLFSKKHLRDITTTLDTRTFSVINGQFFDPTRSNTPLSFGIKVNGVVRTAGADNRDEKKNILILTQTGAKIISYTWENLRDAPGYLALVNLAFEQKHASDQQIGRTYICLKTPNIYNESSTILIFTATAITESLLEQELPRWGCTPAGTSKLDASGSAQLWTQGEYIYGISSRGTPDYRKIPHMLIIQDGV